MAKKSFIGVNNIAKETKKAYIGVDDVARKIKKIYLGVEGKARLCFSGEIKEIYYVTFLDWDDRIISRLATYANGSVTPPSNPTREGYTFAGWSGSYTNVTENRTVRATYTANLYTVTYTFTPSIDYEAYKVTYRCPDLASIIVNNVYDGGGYVSFSLPDLAYGTEITIMSIQTTESTPREACTITKNKTITVTGNNTYSLTYSLT